MIDIVVITICSLCILIKYNIQTDDIFLNGYLADILAMPMFLCMTNIWLKRLIKKRIESKAIVLLLTICCSLAWEYVADAVKPGAVFDYMDFVCYFSGMGIYIYIDSWRKEKMDREIVLNGKGSLYKERDISGTMMYFFLVLLPFASLIVCIVLVVSHFVRGLNFFESLAWGESFIWKRGIVSIVTQSPLRMAEHLLAFFLLGSVLGDSVLKKLKCPWCLHFFTMKRISEDIFVESKYRSVSRGTADYSDGIGVDSRGGIYYLGMTSYGTQNGTEETRKYMYNLRCNCCGCIARGRREKSNTQWD